MCCNGVFEPEVGIDVTGVEDIQDGQFQEYGPLMRPLRLELGRLSVALKMTPESVAVSTVPVLPTEEFPEIIPLTLLT